MSVVSGCFRMPELRVSVFLDKGECLAFFWKGSIYRQSGNASGEVQVYEFLRNVTSETSSHISRSDDGEEIGGLYLTIANTVCKHDFRQPSEQERIEHEMTHLLSLKLE